MNNLIRQLLSVLAVLVSAVAFAQGPPSRRGGQPQPAAAVPQPPPTPDEKKCSVQGRVTNSLTGEPVRKAQVTLRRAVSRSNMGGSPFSSASFSRYSATTDPQGMFTIDRIEPGAYRLSGTARGFLSSEYGARQAQESGTTLTLTESQHVTDLQLKLTRQAVLSGAVFDDDGDPVEGASVQVLHMRYSSGKRVLARIDSGDTDDRGQYRIPDIASGKYILMATPPGPSGSRRGGPPEPASSPLETGLASAYYPGVLDAAQAAKLEVTAGSDIGGLDIRLAKSRMFRVSGKILDTTGAGPVRGAMISLFATAGISSNRLRSFVRGQDGSFEILNVPPGSYAMIVTSGGYGGPDRRSAPVMVPLEVRGSNVDGLVVNVGQGQSVSGSVTVEGDAKPAVSSVSVSLSPAVPVPMGGPAARVQSNGSFKIDGIQPGKYLLTVAGVPDGSYVQSIKAGPLEVLGAELDFSGGVAGNIEISLNMNGGQVSGTVQGKDAPAPGVTVVLVPEESRRGQSIFYKIGTTDQSGAFTLKGVAPGEYTAYAWEKIEAGAWQDPDYLATVEGRGERVKVTVGGSGSVQLKLIPEMKE